MAAMESSMTTNQAPATVVAETLQRLVDAGKCVHSRNVPNLVECLKKKAPSPSPGHYQQQYVRVLSDATARATCGWAPVGCTIEGGQTDISRAKLSIVQAPATFSRPGHQRKEYKNAPFQVRLDFCSEAPLSFRAGVQAYALEADEVEFLETWLPTGTPGLLGNSAAAPEPISLKDSYPDLIAGINTISNTTAAFGGGIPTAHSRYCASVDLSFDKLMFEGPSKKEPRFLVFVMDLPDLGRNSFMVYTLWKIPTIVMSHSKQVRDSWKILWGDAPYIAPNFKEVQTPAQSGFEEERGDIIAPTPGQNADLVMMISPEGETTPLEVKTPHAPLSASLVARELEMSRSPSPLVEGPEMELESPPPSPAPAAAAFLTPTVGIPAPSFVYTPIVAGIMPGSFGWNHYMPLQGTPALYQPATYEEYYRCMAFFNQSQQQQQQLAVALLHQSCPAYAPATTRNRSVPLQFAAPPLVTPCHGPSPIAAGTTLQFAPAAAEITPAQGVAPLSFSPQTAAPMLTSPVQPSTCPSPVFQQPTQQQMQPTPTMFPRPTAPSQIHPQPQLQLPTAPIGLLPDSSIDYFVNNVLV